MLISSRESQMQKKIFSSGSWKVESSRVEAVYVQLRQRRKNRSDFTFFSPSKNTLFYSFDFCWGIKFLYFFILVLFQWIHLTRGLFLKAIFIPCWFFHSSCIEIALETKDWPRKRVYLKRLKVQIGLWRSISFKLQSDPRENNEKGNLVTPANKKRETFNDLFLE